MFKIMILSKCPKIWYYHSFASVFLSKNLVPNTVVLFFSVVNRLEELSEIWYFIIRKCGLHFILRCPCYSVVIHLNTE